MPKYMKHFITLAGVIVIASFLVFLHSCINSLAGFAGQLNPTLQPWVYWTLFGAVSACLGWIAAVALLRPKPMLVYADATEDDLAKFRKELLSRLKRNRHLRDSEVVINDESDISTALTVLKDKADEEIRATGKKVFIGTAISQNGRLDTLVVLFLITRLIWRIARLYNQRPHYRELINLYGNIAATSFLAGSIEELGIEEYVAELMGPLLGGSAMGAVPGAQAIAGTITESVLSGSTNCLLTLRCGVVARNYMALDLPASGSMRRSATAEASKMFVSMSGETVTYVTKALVKGATGAVKTGSVKAAKSVGDTVSSATGAVGNGARKVKDGVKDTASSVGKGVKNTATTVGSGVKNTATTVGNGAKKVGTGITDSARTAGEGVRQTAATVSNQVKDKATFVGKTVKETASTVNLGVKNTAKTVHERATNSMDKSLYTAKKATATVADQIDSTKITAINSGNRIRSRTKDLLNRKKDQTQSALSKLKKLVKRK